ncbi:hypothetical protein M8009_00800 [Halomonas sp. ATCH28]|uniref:5-bromo-4-chloroindolyl phosphate hydrolysis protein n=1 Tax=Halomonas gemina TaxID=2945105 RepID=A0ABT0SX01_9GAMM|nr:hypothetical protein [Halomonas gemina]MCL7938841.1 hypothetical protein [Halomonas gemina]
MTYEQFVQCMKTPTSLTIIALSSIILIASFVPGVSLGGLSTFGILLTALFALNLTREQIGEWRRKEAYYLCEALERNYRHIKTDIASTINNIRWVEKTSTNSYWAICKSLPLITSGGKNIAYSKCIRHLDFISQHLEAIGKTGTFEARELIEAIYLLHLKINAFNNMPEENIDEQEIKMAAKRINEASQAFEKEHGEGVPLSLDQYIHNLMLYCIKK